MEIIKNYITNNRHYIANKIITLKGLVLHSVGCSQPSPEVFIKQWNTSTNRYLTQLIIGAEKVYEVLPCMQTKGKAVLCWHVGSANNYTIGAEMTEPSTIKYTGGDRWVDLNPEKTKAHVMATYANAVDVFAQICSFHDLDPLKDGVILSHNECHIRGIGTSHTDVEHIWNKFGLTMDQFRKDVKSAMNKGTNVDIEKPIKPVEPTKSTIKKGDVVSISPNATYYNGKSVPNWVKNQLWIVKNNPVGDRAIINKSKSGTYAINSPINIKYLTVAESPFKEYMVRISIDNLNIRTGPSTSYPRIGCIPKGVFTIVEENGKWGRLKSRQKYNGKYVAGWIHLDYTSKV